MADFPASEAEARSHIDAVRRQLGIGVGIPGTDQTNLENALRIISDELYQKPCHFLLELIQNADDNQYPPTAVPTLEITYSHQFLRITCNECGFTRGNVEALCKIGSSSKTGQSRSYTGEKGIGFKSVFKIADVAWIRSGNYSLKFDTSTALGMLAPVFARFPVGQSADPGQTTILLQLKDDCDRQSLQRELQILDPRLLLFLRRLKAITIKIDTDNEPITTLTKSVEQGQDASVEVVSLRKLKASQRFVVFRDAVLGLPTNAKRGASGQSDITVAFPIIGSTDENPPSQQVYAFLPIGDFGLKFLVNADFILTASRGAILEDLPWNIGIRNALPAVLYNAIPKLKNTPLRFSWPAFLPFRSQSQGFFADVEHFTLMRIAQLPVVESMVGTMCVPQTLTAIPTRFRDFQGVPMVPSEDDEIARGRYLSIQYHGSHLSVLKGLGVVEMSPDEFLTALEAMIIAAPAKYHAKPVRWHSSLAAQLSGILAKNSRFLTRIETLPLIPLRDGRWVSGRERIAVFASNAAENSAPIPKGIDIGEVTYPAMIDPDRKLLFSTLGVGQLTPDAICERLVAMHQTDDPRRLTAAMLISHISYMYHSGYKNPRNADLWFVAQDNQPRHGRELYLLRRLEDANPEDRAAQWLKEPQLLHTDYLTTIEKDHGKMPKFRTWLTKHCHVGVVLRLVTQPDQPVYTISPEFDRFLRNDPIAALTLLRDNWISYKTWFIPQPRPETAHVRRVRLQSARNLVAFVSEVPVHCIGYNYTNLRHTSLPRESLLRRPEGRFFLDVPDAESLTWDFLRLFGVSIQIGISSVDNKAGQYLQRLEQLRDGCEDYSVETVVQIYASINQNWEGDLTELRAIFRERKLIYARPTGATEDAWYTSADCCWSGQRALRKTPLLRLHFGDLRVFFVEKLMIPPANAETVMRELQQVSLSDKVDYIVGLFSLLQKVVFDLEELQGEEMAMRLQENFIFPLQMIEGSVGRNFCDLGCAVPSSEWFVADRPHLREAFEGIIPLLSVKDQQFLEIRNILGAFGLSRRFLSTLTRREIEVEGQAMALEGITSLMRQKVRLIARIIPREHPNRNETLHRMLNLEVFQVPRLTVHWILDHPSAGRIRGRPERGRGTIHETEAGLDVWLTKEISRASLPIDVVEDFVKLFGELDAKATGMLHYILMEPDLGRIADYLDRRGHRADTTEDWLSSDGWNNLTLGRCPVNFHKRTVDNAENKAYIVQGSEHESSIRPLLNKRWEGNSVDNMRPLLKRFCTVENQDPTLFLPANPLDAVLDPDGTGNDDLLETRFNATLDSRGMVEFSKTTLAIPGVLHITRKNQRQWMVFGPPNDRLDDELIFVGELYVSRLLEMHLDKAYDPEMHWTSSLRTRAGLKPFQPTAEYSPAFTIMDSSKSLLKVFGKKGLDIQVSKAVSHIRFHIDVITVKGDLEGGQFFMHPKQLKHFEEHRLPPSRTLTQPIPIVPILIAVCRVYTKPSAVIIFDPYSHCQDGSVQLSYPGHLRGRFRLDSSEHATLEDAIELNIARRGSIRVHQRIRSLMSGVPTFDYKYQPLPSHLSIRLLELQPDSDKSSLLHGKIHTIKALNTVKEFYALSYPWGISIKPHKIHTPEGVAWLTQSCDTALRNIRRTDSPILVWVDTICIDQDNAHEKAIQIRLMRDIFRAARHVYAWVGDTENNSALAIRTLVEINAMSRIRTLSSPQLDYFRDNENDMHQPLMSPHSLTRRTDTGVPPDNDPAWEAIDHFFDRPWFRRAWVTQEVVLARELTVICGDDRIVWEELFGGLAAALTTVQRLMEAKSFNPPRPILQKTEPATILGRTKRLYSRRNGTLRLDFLTLLDRFTHTKASLDRDKLFALVGLACDADEDIFNADYTSPLEKVVRRYASEFVKRDRALDLLYKAGLETGYSFASWIPHWTEETPRRTISTWSGSRGAFSACGRAGLFARISPTNSKLLEITGTLVDSITSLGEKTQRETDFWSVQNEIYRSLKAMSSYPTGEPISEVQTRLPIGDASRPYRESPTHIELDDSQGPFGGGEDNINWAPNALEVPSFQELVDFFNDPGRDGNRMWRYWETAVAFSLRLGHGRFATTSGGYAGLVPHGTQIGDRVVVFHGAAVPFVIRYHPVKLEWTLVGECYVHGLMYGEVESLGRKEEQVLLH